MKITNGVVRLAALQTLACASGLALATPGTAYADPAQFDIVAQPLPSALRIFAEQAKMQLLYRYDVVSQATAHAVQGRLEPHAALDELLRGTGLKAIYSGDSTATIRAIAGVPNAEGRKSQGNNHTNSVNSSDNIGTLQEVTVTAQRRKQRLEDIPYSITVVGADKLTNTGVTDIASLSGQVPGLSMYDFGARNSAFVFPIIRGLNTDAPLTFRSIAQAPVGIYIGNSPIAGYFQLDDIQRIEILRGPQGTLYGAGALGGALRIIPNAPILDSLAGNVEIGGGSLAGADTPSYTAAGMINVPIGDTLAFRASGKYDYEPGFINVYGILKRPGPILTAIPTLADPADPVNSPGVFSGQSDWNYQRTFTGRASLLWRPIDKFNAQLAFTYSHLTGDGSNDVNPDFPGGAYPIDPSVTFPRGGWNEELSPADQPYSRNTSLTSLDTSYDAGFATVSSTSSYGTTSGAEVGDNTYTYFTIGPSFYHYYAGNPTNPRWVLLSNNNDTEHTFTQEVRLVSTTRPDKLLDYVVGMFYEDQKRDGYSSLQNPGAPEDSIVQGCTAPFFFGAQFPNCEVIAGPNDTTYHLSDGQRFHDVSEYGELTWHVTTHGNLTFGARHTNQIFSDVQVYKDWVFGTFSQSTQSTTTSQNLWEINPSYEYLPGQHVYALWSQGFRRGGVNAVPTAGSSLFYEFPVLLTYRPDTVDNYETGLKGRISSGFTYAFDVFDMYWNNPQIEGQTPATNIAVWNAKKARSTGAELDISSPLPLQGLSVSAGGAYTNARLTEDYLIVADPYGNIAGKAGQQLPGSPKVSGAVTINYNRSVGSRYFLSVSLNDTYRGQMLLNLPVPTTFLAAPAATQVSSINIVNFSASIDQGSWRLGAYVTNLADRRVVLFPPQYVSAAALDNNYLINQPREISVRLRYSFGLGAP